MLHTVKTKSISDLQYSCFFMKLSAEKSCPDLKPSKSMFKHLTNNRLFWSFQSFKGFDMYWQALRKKNFLKITTNKVTYALYHETSECHLCGKVAYFDWTSMPMRTCSGNLRKSIIVDIRSNLRCLHQLTLIFISPLLVWTYNYNLSFCKWPKTTGGWGETNKYAQIYCSK